MATFQKFTDIEAWQKARELTFEIYEVTKRAPFSRDFELRGQIREASVSIMSNIAEGFDRSGTGEFIQFLSIAKGSAAEVVSQLYVALDQKYISTDEFERLCSLATEVGRKLGALIRYLRKSGIRGAKFRETRNS
ncbi:MAG TPA: four helix bundle protein [Candidatus Binatia bacterium]|nr:four helix bundle protein [Candidatus Binatia bacterium]